MNAKNNGQKPLTGEMGPIEVSAACLESPGYLLFAAHLTDQADREGRSQINFRYIRHHFAIEDAKNAILQLKKFVDDEWQRLAESSEV